MTDIENLKTEIDEMSKFIFIKYFEIIENDYLALRKIVSGIPESEASSVRNILNDFEKKLRSTFESKDLFLLRQQYKTYIELLTAMILPDYRKQLTEVLDAITDFECFYSQTEEIINDYIEKNKNALIGGWVAKAKAFNSELEILYSKNSLADLGAAIQNFCYVKIKASTTLKPQLLKVWKSINEDINIFEPQNPLELPPLNRTT